MAVATVEVLELDWVRYRLRSLSDARFHSGISPDEEAEYRMLAAHERDLLAGI